MPPPPSLIGGRTSGTAAVAAGALAAGALAPGGRGGALASRKPRMSATQTPTACALRTLSGVSAPAHRPGSDAWASWSQNTDMSRRCRGVRVRALTLKSGPATAQKPAAGPGPAPRRHRQLASPVEQKKPSPSPRASNGMTAPSCAMSAATHVSTAPSALSARGVPTCSSSGGSVARRQGRAGWQPRSPEQAA